MSLKLTYFDDQKGRNELVRLIFAVGEVEYHDDLVGFSRYQTMRDTGLLPWGQLPVLAIKSADKGKEEVFGQSCSIARYAAKVAKLYPQNDKDALRSDEVVDSWRDFLDLYYDCFFDRKILGGKLQMVPRKPAQRQLKFQDFANGEMKETFATYERILANNGGQVCVDDTTTFPCWADLAIYDLVKTMEGPTTRAQFEALMLDKKELKKLVQKIECLPTIQKHLKTYPYKDVQWLFVSGSWWRQLLDSLLFPVLEIALSLKSRVASFRKLKNN